MTATTVPRPPATDDLWAETEDIAPALINWQAVGIIVLTCVPVTLAWVAGMSVRCGSLILAAIVEGYRVGRGTETDA